MQLVAGQEMPQANFLPATAGSIVVWLGSALAANLSGPGEWGSLFSTLQASSGSLSASSFPVVPACPGHQRIYSIVESYGFLSICLLVICHY